MPTTWLVPRISEPRLCTAAGSSAFSAGSAWIEDTTSWVGSAVDAAWAGWAACDAWDEEPAAGVTVLPELEEPQAVSRARTAVAASAADALWGTCDTEVPFRERKMAWRW
ncbi:hypothetical protein [Streptacidiphilus sp. PAMC 29251]